MKKNNNWSISAFFIIIIFFSLAIFRSKDQFLLFDENDPDNKENNINSTMPYLSLINYLDMGWIKKIDLYDNSKIAIVEANSPELGDRSQKIRVEIPVNATALMEKLKKTNVDINAHPLKKNILKLLYDTYVSFLIPTIIVGVLFIISRRWNQTNRNSGNNRNSGGSINTNLNNNRRNEIMNKLRQTSSEIQVNPDTGVTFNDIAGIDEVKEDLKEIVTFINQPKRFSTVGANIPKGVLLVGPPGTGKTLLAKAIAGEAKVSFISISGSEFVEMFVGIGASRVRDLFLKAKNNTPCIIFIDEIDAVGRRRGVGIGGGNDEREQTLNQLLTEMDGFEGNKGIIVIAATNRPDVLDNALLRPGRFDRQVTVNSPDKVGREAILKIHAKNKKLSNKVSLELIAQRTPGFAGADLSNVLNEAAIITARKEKLEIDIDEINDAIERVIAGLEGNSIIDNKNKRLVAYHETGHAIAATLLKDHENVQTVTVLPRGEARGLTWFLPNEDPTLISRNQIISRIVAALSGRAAEKVVFGKQEFTSGAAGDMVNVTQMAKQMVYRFGMSQLPAAALTNRGGKILFVGRGIKPANEFSNSLAIKIDSQITCILELCYTEALEIMELNRVILDKIVNKLIDDESISGKSFEEIICKFSKLPINRTSDMKLTLK